METTAIINNKNEAMIIRQALRVWRGDFPDSGCEPSLLWQKELTKLIDKYDALLKEDEK